MKKIELIGKVIGELTVLSEHSTRRSGEIRWACKCSCGNTANVLGSHLRSQAITHCGCKKPFGKHHHAWGGVGDISGNFWFSHIVTSASGSKGSRKPLELSITIEEAWELYEEQKGLCKLSGLPIKFPNKSADKSWTCSLDRIDSSKGYTLDNVQWVHKDINMMKRIYNNEYFISMCKEVAKNNSGSTGNNCEVL